MTWPFNLHKYEILLKTAVRQTWALVISFLPMSLASFSIILHIPCAAIFCTSLPCIPNKCELGAGMSRTYQVGEANFLE